MLRQLDRKIVLNSEVAKEPNLCDRFSDEDLTKIGQWTYEGYERDKLSRYKWERRTEAAMDLAMQVQKDKNFPWQGCANVVFPLVTIAALQFSSRSYGNIIQGTEVVKYRIVGKDPDQALRDKADRISKHMSWQVLEEDTGWEEQHDRLFINLAIVGSNFVKTYYSTSQRCNVSELVMSRDLVLDYWAKSVEQCSRKTQIIPMYRNDIYEKIVGQTYRDVRNSEWFNSVPAQTSEEMNMGRDNRKGLTPPPADEDTPFKFLEQHRLLDLDQDGYAEPYIVTIEQSTKTVMKIAARWEREEDIDRTDFPGKRSVIKRIRPTEYYTKYGFIPSPDGGIYDVGFGTLLGPLNESVNSGINQLLDAGTMSNSNGGFLARGVKIRGGVYTMAPWEWKRVDSTGDDLRKSMVPLPVREPSDVMFKLLGLLIEYTEKIASTTDSMSGVSPGQNTPAETSRNTLEQGMKVYQGIFKRIWRSMKEEFKKRHQLNALYLQSNLHYGQGANVRQEDYRSDPDQVIPAADPNLVSDAQRIQQAAAMREGAHQVPGYDISWVERNWLKALKVDAIDAAYPGADKTGPLPNPKLQVEQLKAQIAMAKIDFEKKSFIAELMEGRKKTQAEIIKLLAEASALMAQAQTEKVRLRLDALNSYVEMLKAHNDMATQRIEAMQGDKDGEGNPGNGGAVGGLDAAPGQQGATAPTPPPIPAGSNGAMGGGGFPGGH